MKLRSLIILQLLLYLVLLSVTLFNLDEAHLFFTNDAGFVFSVAENILSNKEFPLLGPNSHVGGRHLGAWYFYFLAFLYKISGKDVLLCAKFLAAIKILVLQLSLLLFAIKSERKTSSLLACAIVMLCFVCNLNDFPLRVPWHGCEILIGSCFLAYGLWLILYCNSLGSFALAASLAVQLHYGFTPIVFAILVSLLFVDRNILFKRQNNLSKYLFLLTTISWIPTIYFISKYNFFIFTKTVDNIQVSQESLGYIHIIKNNLFSLLDQFKFSSLDTLFGIVQLNKLILFIFICIAGYAITLQKNRKNILLLFMPSLMLVLTLSVLRRQIDLYIWHLVLSFNLIIIMLLLSGLIAKFKPMYTIIVIVFLSLFLIVQKLEYNLLESPFGLLRSLKGAKILSAEITKNTDLKEYKIITSDYDELAEGAIYFLLGSNFYSNHRHSSQFKELSFFNKRNKSCDLFLISSINSPKLTKHWRFTKNIIINNPVLSKSVKIDHYRSQASRCEQLKLS